jgi:DNA-binding NarL/FixJ family response regulator
VRVVIAEDSALLRAGLIRLLQDEGHEVVADVADGPSLVDAIALHRPELAIVDVRLPPSFRDEGLRAALEARSRVPATAVVILSQYVEERYATELIERSAEGVGYLLKDRVADVATFMATLRQVASGGTVFDPEVISQLFARKRRRARLDELTAREREVLALMAAGRSNEAIADQLRIGEGAIEKHVSNILGKLGLEPTDSAHNRRVLAVLSYLEQS